jgi:hypothetical protein
VIELVPAEHDDLAFLSLAQRIMNGAIAELRRGEVFLVHVDTWFDHKWLGWWSRKEEELRLPTFTPNRVHSEKHYVWNPETSAWDAIGLPKALHVRQPGRPWLAQPIDRFSESAAFIWYSGNTATNKVGSLMFNLSGAEGYSWYASLKKSEEWTVADECRITRRGSRSRAEGDKRTDGERALKVLPGHFGRCVRRRLAELCFVRR